MYSFNHESAKSVLVQYQGQTIGHIRESGGYWAFYSTEVTYSLQTLQVIVNYITILETTELPPELKPEKVAACSTCQTAFTEEECEDGALDEIGNPEDGYQLVCEDCY